MNDPLLDKPQFMLDPNLQSGPSGHRPCRDPIFAILFLLYVAFMTYIAILGFIDGNPELLLTPFDSSGHQCKFDKSDTDYSNYQYVSIYRSPESNNWVGTCVKGCSEEDQKICKTNNVTTDCTQVVVYPAWTLGSICVPNSESDQIKLFFNSIGLTTFTEMFQDIQTAWPVVTSSIGISAVLSLGYVVLLQHCVGFVIWGGILLFLVAFGGVGIIMIILPYSDTLKNMIHWEGLPPTLQSLDVIQGVGIACVSIFGVFLLMVLCFCKRINIAIAILKAAGDFMKSNLSILFVPIITLLIDAITIIAWLVVMLFLASCGTITAPNDPSGYVPFGLVDWTSLTRYFMIAEVFGIVWQFGILFRILMFISGAEKFIISSAVAIWYFEEGYPERPILRSFPRMMKSAGSIALGSFLLMLTFILRLIMAYINYEYEKANKGNQNLIAKCCLKCCQCIVQCFTKCIEFITDKAYIMMAISGKSFCNSAAEGTGLTISSFGQAVAVETSTRIFGIIGRLLITGATTVICLIMITSIPSISFNLFSTLGPILSFVLISFCISTIFIECYRMIAETLLMCYCIEKQFNGVRYKCPNQVRHLIQDYVDESTI